LEVIQPKNSTFWLIDKVILNIMFKINRIVYLFGKSLKVKLCPSWGYGRDLSLLKQ